MLAYDTLGAKNVQREQIQDDVAKEAFEFFYWFSRFEFALKDAGYLKSEKVGAPAEPGWDAFVRKYEGRYSLTAKAQELLDANPERQVVGRSGLEFRPVSFEGDQSDLSKIVRLTKTVRNNLFHGGKDSAKGWDDQSRMQTLLPLVVAVIDEFAQLAEIAPHYRRRY